MKFQFETFTNYINNYNKHFVLTNKNRNITMKLVALDGDGYP